MQPYDQRHFYLDLFDFAVVDALMYHFDSKHYSLTDGSSADGLVVRLDHGRASVSAHRYTGWPKKPAHFHLLDVKLILLCEISTKFYIFWQSYT